MLTSINIHIVSINVQQALMNVNGYNSFHMEEFNRTPLLGKYSMLDAILSEFPSDAISHVATTCNIGILVGRFNLYGHTTNICLWCCGPPSYNGRHYFWSSPYMRAETPEIHIFCLRKKIILCLNLCVGRLQCSRVWHHWRLFPHPVVTSSAYYVLLSVVLTCLEPVPW